jgi:2-keto-4-pentenoate hydratase/2-oxohepta-3-ene-1,7-dioic acid hydratase in catechol pathway
MQCPGNAVAARGIESGIMKLLTFEQAGEPRLGVLDESGDIIDVALRDRSPMFGSMQALIEAGPDALHVLRGIASGGGETLSAHAVRWLAPLPQPAQMRDFIVFEQHMKMAGWNGRKLRAKWDGTAPPAEAPPIPAVWYQQPIYYKCNRFAVAGPDTRVTWPPFSKVIDFELELACVIGRRGKDIAVENAAEHIFGYTIFNDLTARDTQFTEMQGPLGPAKGKDFDGANILGPVIVTADAIDPTHLAMRALVNDEIWSEGSSATMYWSFSNMIAHVSRSETLYPGEVLGSGTMGNGCGLELGRFLQHADVITLEVEGIGALRTGIDAPHVPQRVTL